MPVTAPAPRPQLHFDAATAFAHLSTGQLKKAWWVYKAINYGWFVKAGSAIGGWAPMPRNPSAEPTRMT